MKRIIIIIGITMTFFTCQNKSSQTLTTQTTIKASQKANHQKKTLSTAVGHQQSPINIPGEYLCRKSPKHLVNFHYKSSPKDIVNTGHTVRLEYEAGSSLTFDGKEYNLKQFHFHTPAEHHMQGIIYPMEMHLVHQNTQGDYLVIGLMFKEGKPNPTLADILHDTPHKQGKVHTSHLVNAANLLPQSQHFYSYKGSLTTPPYTEGVRWLIFREVVEASAEQIKTFKALEGENIRANQLLFNRVVEEF